MRRTGKREFGGRASRIVHTPLDPMHLTKGTEPGPQRSQSGHGVGLRDLGADLGALCEKRFSSEKGE